MNGFERCAAALSWQTPDRVPVIPQNSDMAIQHAGFSMIDASKDGEMIAEALIKAQREFGFDGIMLGPDAAILGEAIGCRTEYRHDDPPGIVAPFLDSLDDLDRLQPLDILNDGRMKEWLKATKIIKKELGDSVFLITRADQGAFDIAALLLGMENLSIELATGENKEKIHRLLEYGWNCHIAFAAAIKDAGAHMTTCGDSYSGPTLIGPAKYKEYSFPYEKRAVQEIENKIGISYSIHICGDTNGIHDIWPDTGATMFEVDHLTDILSLRKTTLGKTTLMGNLDTSMLCIGQPEDVETACKELLDIMLPESGFILSSGCSMSGNSSDELLAVMVECAEKYGRY